ncbi:MAG: hypothetical protein WA667_05970, partial [Candidatus Nitrosopolaris sp.]
MWRAKGALSMLKMRPECRPHLFIQIQILNLAFEDETTITQKPCIRKSLSFEAEQQKIGHNGSRKKFSAYISMVWHDE